MQKKVCILKYAFYITNFVQQRLNIMIVVMAKKWQHEFSSCSECEQSQLLAVSLTERAISREDLAETQV